MTPSPDKEIEQAIDEYARSVYVSRGCVETRAALLALISRKLTDAKAEGAKKYTYTVEEARVLFKNACPFFGEARNESAWHGFLSALKITGKLKEVI